jgi:hypothetical protein
VDWIESALNKKLPNRLIPDNDVLIQAYRRALAAVRINKAIEDTAQIAIEQAKEAHVPASLRDKLKTALEKSQGSWDLALYRLTKEQLDSSDD